MSYVSPRKFKMKIFPLFCLSVVAFCTTSVMAQPVKLTGAAGMIAPGERSGAIYSVAFSPDSKTLASGDDKGQISLWDTATNKLTATLMGHKSFVNSLAWSAAGDQLLSVGTLINKNGSVGGGELKIWDVATGKPRLEMSWPDYFANLAAWSPDGKTIALAGSKSEADKLFPQVELRDAETGKLLRTLTPHRDNKSLNRLQFSPDSKLLLTLLHWDSEGNLWDVASGESVRELKPSPDLQVPFAADVFAFSPDSQSLARGRFDGNLILESTRSGEWIQTFKIQAPFPLVQVRFSPDGAVLSSLTAFEIFQWNATTGQLLRKIRHAANGDAALSADGSLVASHANRELFLERLPENP